MAHVVRAARAMALVVVWCGLVGRASAQESAPITLPDALAHADRSAPALRVAIAQLARGEAARTIASPDFPANPELEIVAGPRATGDWVDADVTVALSQRIEIAGEPGMRRAAAARLAERYEAELARVRWEVHWQVHQAYHLALVARERALALERVLAFTLELQEIMRARTMAGEASELDVRVAGVDVAQAQQAATQAAQEYVAARLTLAELAGLPIAPLPEPVGALDPPASAPPIARLVAMAEDESPVLRALEVGVAATVARVEAEEREVWPEPAIGVMWAREGSTAPNSPPSDSVLGFVSIPFPVFQPNLAGRAEARADAAIARAELDAFEATLAARIARLASAVDAAARRLAIYGSDILPAFEESLEMLRQGFELGELDILEVAVARERFLRLQQDALAAWADYHRALAELESVVGAEVVDDSAHGVQAHEHREGE